MPELAFPETGEVKNITDCECSTDFVERYENDILIAELNNKPSLPQIMKNQSHAQWFQNSKRKLWI